MDATRTCSVPECSRGGYLTRGLCKTHYARFRRHGEVGSGLVKSASYDGVSCAHCERRAVACGLCSAHYKRMRRHGTPLGQRSVMTEDERFLPHVTVGAPPSERPGLGACWNWTGVIGDNGYGYVSTHRGGHRLAHRVSYQRHVGAIPDGAVIDHLCRNRACVNPDHLEAVSNEENLRRGLGYRLRNGMDDCCINGHRYTIENTYINPNDSTDMRCRACSRIRSRKVSA